MKHRIINIYFSPLLILVLVCMSLLGPFIKPVNAASYCSQYNNKTQQAQCNTQYAAGQKYQNVSGVCSTTLDGFPSIGGGNSGSGTAFFICESSWAAGANAAGHNVPTPGAGSRGTTQSFCQLNFTGDYLNNCNKYAAEAKGGKTVNCNSDALCNISVLSNGGKTSTPVVGGSRGTQPSAAAAANCSGQTGSAYTACVSGYDGHGCSGLSGADLTACNGGKAAAAAATATGPTTGTASSSLDCELKFSNPLTWIICPVVDALSGIISGVDSIITAQMDIQPNSIFCSNTNQTSTCQGYYSAWQSFRDIALGFLVLVGLVIVSAEAIGSEILDAYTVRKTLPRLLVAAIGITISWPLMKFMLVVSNDLGIGIRHLIYYPFTKIPNGPDLSFGGDVSNFFFGSAAVAGGALAAVPAWIAFGGLGALISFAATGALAVIVAIVVLTLRQIAIILLMLLAPLAIVAYILPNTNRLYKVWWESFSRALLMFPMIAGFIAIGHVFAAVSFNSGGAFNQFIGFIAYFAPYFLIPLTFRMAGGAVSALGGFVNQRSQGTFNALKGYRQNQTKKRVTAARDGGLYRNKTGFLTKNLNRIGAYTLDADEQIPLAIGNTSGTNRLSRFRRLVAGRQALELGDALGQASQQHTEAASKKAGLHHTTDNAILGERDVFKGGMDPEKLKDFDKKYGEKDEHGALIMQDVIGKNGEVERDKQGNVMREVARWEAPEDHDTEGIRQYGLALQDAGLAGSEASFAGKQLETRAGTLASFNQDPETKRATMRTVAMAGAAAEGKVTPEALASWYNKQRKAVKGDSVEEAILERQYEQYQQVAERNRPSLRFGKGILKDQNGDAYSVMSDKAIIENGKEIKAYESKAAKTNLETLRVSQIGGAKGEIVDDMKASWLHWGGKNAPDAATKKQVEQQVGYLISSWGPGDPGGKKKLMEFADQILTPVQMEDALRERPTGQDAEGAQRLAPLPPEEPK